MTYAAAGQVLCYLVITITISQNENASLPGPTRLAWAKASIGFFFLYYVFFGIGWQGFYIIWTVFNAAFVLIVYFLYPETADRSLEDLDRFFAGNAPLFVWQDKDAIANKRPQAFVEREEEVRRASSIRPADVAVANAHRESVLRKEKSEDERREAV
ncbi:uncharacterized protein BDZ99DRAFT_564694 [Mytilinidion resinicola]|uniref:General substrate transporter n=1 Tax=Mytilinidion resinicola TaxID=574789 RepID=A0A6A6Z735_9PEZI|nr:uncharacterized protein BDZ99DRAFT_564694 [Mytilinidion resinicola]KAF2816866.1 hypothetical protein BDZ99DRAFT_564694 [Mytilinidion resinicola]